MGFNSKFIPTKHDHVGRMTWRSNMCWCSDCGQTWGFKEDKGWKVIPEWAGSFGDVRDGWGL